jgi:hypothetical protein
MSEDMTPTEGARFLLERREVAMDDAQAAYSCSIFTPETRTDYDLLLDLSGNVMVVRGTGSGDPDLEETLLTIAKLLARSAAKKRTDGLPPWPPRVLRWRGPGRG